MTPLPAAEPEADAAYRAAGWWGDELLGDVVRRHATTRPDATAIADELGNRMSWSQYDAAGDEIAGVLIEAGLARGDRVAVFLPDGPLVHATFLGAERAGCVVMGIGNRAGDAELAHLVRKSGAKAIVTLATDRDQPLDERIDRLRAEAGTLSEHIVLPKRPSSSNGELQGVMAERRLDPSELFLLNSTSGTTGLPKCVMHTQNRWFYFHRLAAEYGALTADDTVMSVVPAPFGFGLWTAHFTPTLLGVPCIVTSKFSPETMIESIERERVTVLCCVSTQFIMMLNSPALEAHDLSSLRVMFTGGEAIPYARALEFEERTHAVLLNFYGSNETGMLSGSRVTDDRAHRLTTGGRCEPVMQTRLYDAAGSRARVPGDRGRGVPACRGPATSLGYYDDDDANAQLFSDDGWMFMGDVVKIDDDGWLTVVGRTSDFIIRGGKNISAVAVEEEVAAHPLVKIAAVVPVPDEVFGERVAAYVELVDGAELTLDALSDFLRGRGVSREWVPEHLFVVDTIPRSSGGKVAKGDLSRDGAARVARSHEGA